MQITEIIHTDPGRGKYFCRKMFQNVFWMSSLSSMGLVAANIMDAVVVGRQMGASGLAAIGIVSPIYVLYNILGLGFAVGGSVSFSKQMGCGQEKEANTHFNQMMVVSLLIAFVLGILGNIFMNPLLRILGGSGVRSDVLRMCREYASLILWTFPIFMANFVLYEFVRCDDDQKVAAISHVVGCFADVGLNWILVVFMNLGVRGAAWATVIGQALSVSIFTLHFIGNRYSLHIQPVRIELKKIMESFKIGISVSSRYFFQCLYLIMVNNLLMKYAPDGNLYVAVFDVVMNVTYIGCFIYSAACETMSPLAATFYAEHNRENLIYLLKTAIGYGCIGSIGLGIILAAFAGPVAAMFGLENAISVAAIRAYCISISFTAYVEIAAGFYQAIEKPKAAGAITLLRNCVILLPVSLVIGRFFTEYFWFSLPIEEFITALAASYFIDKAMPKEEEGFFSYTLKNDRKDLQTLLGLIEEYLEKCEASMKQAYVVSMVVEEMCGVIIQQAFKNNEDEYIQITITPEQNDNISLVIRDSASSFNPFEMDSKEVQEDLLEMDSLSGLGILMIKKKAKEFYYRRYQGFNVTTVIV